MIKKIAPWAGIIGAVLFPLTFTLNGWLRQGYNPLHMYVRELSIGPQGWIQIVNFLILGICLALFAVGVSKVFTDGKASRSGPIILMIIAVCYFLSGPFVTDSSSMFDNQQSLHGTLHGIFGALVFSLSAICCFVFWRRFRIDTNWKHLQRCTFLAGIIMVIAVVLMKIAQLQSSALNEWAGLIQRCALITFYVWIFTFSLRLRKYKRQG
jgi:hypothetical protein